MDIMGHIWNAIYGFFLLLDSGIYKLIGWVYQIFIMISSARIFKTDTFDTFINRIYIILGVVMLFYLAYSLLRAIADPDSLTKNDTSMIKIVSNTVISLIIIAVIPTIFNFLYTAQDILLEQNIIGKIILGNYSSAANNLEVTLDDEEVCSLINNGSTDTGSCKKVYRSDKNSKVQLAGNSIAVDVFTAFFYPNSDNQDSDTDLATENEFYNTKFQLEDLEEANYDELNNKEKTLWGKMASYNSCHDESEAYSYGQPAADCATDMLMAQKQLNGEDTDIGVLEFKSVMQYAKTNGDFSGFRLLAPFVTSGDMDYMIIISTIAGAFVLYIMVSYCLDMGLRAAKLGFAQLIAPVPILSRIVPSQKKMYDTWFKFTLTSYFEVFLRIATIFLGIFMVTNLPDIQGLWDQSSLSKAAIMSIKFPLLLDIQASWGVKTFARTIVIMGILMFIKQAPKLITQALGINVDVGSLKIRDKIRNNMLGGQLVAKGMDKVAALPGKGYGALSGAAGGLMAASNNGGDAKAALLKGAKEGYKKGGGQFRNRYQATYADLSGDRKYKGSYFHEGRGFLEEKSRQIDENYKAASKAFDEHNSQIVERVENDYQEMKNRNQVALNNMEEGAQFQNTYNNLRTQAIEDFMNNGGSDIVERMKNYQNSEEFAKIRDAAMGLNNGQSLEENIKQALQEANTQSAQQYLKDYKEINDTNRQLDARAKEEAREEFKQTNEQYKKILDNINQSLDDYVKSRPDAKEYYRVLEQLDNKGKFQQQQQWEKNFDAMVKKYGTKDDKK